MEENLAGNNMADSAGAFFIEVPLNEEGPKKLRVVPTGNEYEVYYQEAPVAKLKQQNDEWEQTDGELSPGIIKLLGLAIQRYYS